MVLVVVKMGTLGCGGKVGIRGRESSLLGVHVASRVGGGGGGSVEGVLWRVLYSRDLQKIELVQLIIDNTVHALIPLM